MKILADKTVVKSMTFWGGVVVALVEGLKQGGLLDPGFATQIATFVQFVGGFVATMGLRRAAGQVIASGQSTTNKQG